jgi:hypothetical protein
MRDSATGYAGSSEVSQRIGRLSIPEGLRRQRIELEERLTQVNEAIEALEKNPELERVLHLVSRVT